MSKTIRQKEFGTGIGKIRNQKYVDCTFTECISTIFIDCIFENCHFLNNRFVKFKNCNIDKNSTITNN